MTMAMPLIPKQKNRQRGVMTQKILKNAALRLLVESGSVSALNVVGTDGGWILKVKYGLSEQTLASQARPVRVFKKLDTLVMYLKKIGFEQFDIDTSGYSIDARAGLTRPDRSVALKRIHEAAASHVEPIKR
ncbi:hypothetical protein [Serratia sp. JSRIV006]|uniref:hypothetical protein n=1 Tax=Serratia sp. JSRIV006 TaxID=2831896 RepID=UPI001CBF080D|nr:hypothetical protein [Serratia sp. JSRIV006]UAN65867.1 hypothetical protein KGP16_26810 [Serratia sp. JSRIV006]